MSDASPHRLAFEFRMQEFANPAEKWITSSDSAIFSSNQA